MEDSKDSDGVHPRGEVRLSWESYPPPRRLETIGGGVEVRWEEDSGVSMHGGPAYFIEFLNVSGIWKRFVAACPLKYSSPNAPSNSEILGTILFSVLSGHRRYAHITRIRGDDVLPGLLGIKTLRSEDKFASTYSANLSLFPFASLPWPLCVVEVRDSGPHQVFQENCCSAAIDLPMSISLGQA